jgi:hypothetical protein
MSDTKRETVGLRLNAAINPGTWWLPSAGHGLTVRRVLGTAH